MEFKMLLNDTPIEVQVEMDGNRPLGIDLHSLNTNDIYLSFEDLSFEDQIVILDAIDDNYRFMAELEAEHRHFNQLEHDKFQKENKNG